MSENNCGIMTKGRILVERIKKDSFCANRLSDNSIVPDSHDKRFCGCEVKVLTAYIDTLESALLKSKDEKDRVSKLLLEILNNPERINDIESELSKGA